MQAFAARENVFYILHSKQSKELNVYLDIINKNHHAINILISQAFQIDDAGNLTGYLNRELVTITKNKSIKLMAMITNKGFDQEKLHRFLSSNAAQQKAMQSIIAACKQNNLYGVQFDFEKISVIDKLALTKFFRLAAKQLHHQGYRVSFAIIPAFPEMMQHSSFLKKTWQHWSGAYDLKALGEAGDFITIMAYNQHPDGTIPGPNASIRYTQAAILHALQFIPADKLSLGIPAYSLYWYSGHTSIAMRQAEISYKDAIQLIRTHHSQIVWSDADKIHYSRYEHNWLNEYVYLEDKHSFKAKQDLAKLYGLRGISVFRIGTEDDGIWKKL